MNKLKWIVGISVIGLLAGFLFWPLSSKEFEISWDASKIQYKKSFLNGIKEEGNLEDKPNVLLIIADDLGKYDLSLYKEGPVNTPNIEQLGSEGVVFNNAYVASPVCSPSRAAILTGRYPQRFGFMYQMHEFYMANRLQYLGYKYLINSAPWMPRGIEPVPGVKEAEKQGLPPSEITLPEMVNQLGYATGLIGKWHLGVYEDNVPCNFGFDYQYGFYASHSLYASESQTGIVNQYIDDDFTDPYIWNGQREGAHAIYRNCEEIIEETYLTDAITRECKQFINSNDNRPFFLIASYNAPHTPLQAQEKYIHQFLEIEDPVKRVYYAMIANLDDAIGDLLLFLREKDLDENTLVIFISDNGGASYTHTTDNAPLTGGKITDFEGGLNVPMIMKWKNKIEPDSFFNSPVISMDIFSTIVSQLGVFLPEDRPIDGVDLMPYITGDQTGDPHDYLYWARGKTKAIRSKDYKVIWNETFMDTLMFDVSSDYYEQKNISGNNPEEMSDLISIHNSWMKEIPLPLWPPLVNYAFDYKGKTYYFEN